MYRDIDEMIVWNWGRIAKYKDFKYMFIKDDFNYDNITPEINQEVFEAYEKIACEFTIACGTTPEKTMIMENERDIEEYEIDFTLEENKGRQGRIRKTINRLQKQNKNLIEDNKGMTLNDHIGMIEAKYLKRSLNTKETTLAQLASYTKSYAEQNKNTSDS